MRKEAEAQNKDIDDLTEENELLRNEKNSFDSVRGELESRVAELSQAVDPLWVEVEDLKRAMAEADAANKGLVVELSLQKDKLTAREEELEAVRRRLLTGTPFWTFVFVSIICCKQST